MKSTLVLGTLFFFLTSCSEKVQIATSKTGGTYSLVNIDSNWLSSQGSAPYFLTQSGEYVLNVDVVTSGTAFIVGAPDVTLNLNGHKVTYGESAPISVQNGGFEQGSSSTDIPGWTVSNSSAALRAPARTGMWGQWMFQYKNISSTQTLQSQPIAIPLAGVEYAAAVTPKGPYQASVSLAVIDSVTGATLGTGTADSVERGYSAVAKFTPSTKNPVVLKISVNPGGTATIDLDYVSLTRSADYGVIASRAWWYLPAFLQTTQIKNAMNNAVRFTLKNGTVAQGAGRSHEGNPVYAKEAEKPILDTVTLIPKGMDTHGFEGMYANSPIIKNSTITGQLDRISNRMKLFGTINLAHVAGPVTLTGNTLEGTHHCGIVIYRTGNVTNPVSIASNIIRHTALGTDGYGIVTNNLKNFVIENNKIQPVNGRGLLFDGFSSSAVTDNGTVKNNIIESREVANLEYEGWAMEATALRIRSYEGSYHQNIVFSGNTFFAETGAGQNWAATGLRLTCNPDSGKLSNWNIQFVGNTFKARLNSLDPNYNGAREPRAWGVTMGNIPANLGVSFISNRFESNDISVNIGDPDEYDGSTDNGVYFESNTYAHLLEGAIQPHRPVAIGDWAQSVKNVRFVDNRVESGATPFIDFIQSKPKSAFIGWLLDVTVQNGSGNPLAGASIAIKDAQGQTVFSGVTNDTGSIKKIAILEKKLDQLGSNPDSITTTAYSPHVISATYNSQTGSKTVNVNMNQSVVISIGSSGGGDTAPPVVSVTNPMEGSTVKDQVSVTATASDNVGVTKVEFYVGAQFLGTDTSSPYQAVWDTIGIPNGSYSLRAVAYDAAGNKGEDSNAVTLNNPVTDTTPPTTSITNPVANSNVGGTVLIEATASDDTGISKVEFYLDTTLLGSDTSQPYERSWNTATSVNGLHTLKTRAYDTSGNSAESTPVQVNVSNTMPPTSAIQLIVGAGKYGGAHVQLYDLITGALSWEKFVLSGKNTGVSVAGIKDFSGDGKSELIVGQLSHTGLTAKGLVEVYSNGTLVRSFDAFQEETSGATVAGCDGRVYTGRSLGAAEVRVWDLVSGTQLLGNIFGWNPKSSYSAGVNVACGHVRPGKTDIVVGAKDRKFPSAIVDVKVFSGDSFTTYSGKKPPELWKAEAYAKTYNCSVQVAFGDVNGDGKDELITGAGEGCAGHVRIYEFTGASDNPYASYKEISIGANAFPFGTAGHTYGVTVASGDVDGDGSAEVFVGSRDATGISRVKIFNLTGKVFDDISVFGGKPYNIGVQVGVLP